MGTDVIIYAEDLAIVTEEGEIVTKKINSKLWITEIVLNRQQSINQYIYLTIYLPINLAIHWKRVLQTGYRCFLSL